MKEAILQKLNAECSFGNTLHWFNSIDSTNTRAKLLAAQGVPQGSIVIAGHQTGGRGRLGRCFSSPAGMGIYLSVILRPQCTPKDLMHLTCAAGVAVCDAVASSAGMRPGIKWTNDLVLGNKKLGGILTELSVDAKSGLVEYAVVGVGINCCQKAEDFPEDIRDIAVSLSQVCCEEIDPSNVAAALITALRHLGDVFLPEKDRIMQQYQADCITVGQQIVVLRGDERRYGIALAVSSDGGLVVEYSDGTRQTVTSGEVSVRGMYGYI